MVAQDLIGACDGNRDNGTTGLGGDLESTLLERCHLTGFGTRSLREYKDGDTTLDIIDGCEDHTQTVSGIGTIQKKAVKPAHPYAQEWDFLKIILGDKSGQPRTVCITDHDIKDATVVANIDDGFLGRDIFCALDDDISAADADDRGKGPLHNAQTAQLGSFFIDLAIKPFDAKHRNAND